MNFITGNIILALVLLALNAFFVAAEFALVKVRGVRIEAMAARNRFAAQKTIDIQRNLESYLAACQLGITMTSLGLGWVGEPTVAAMLKPILEPLGFSDAMLHTISFLVGFTVFSSLHIVVGEQVPKTLAIRKAESTALLIAYPLYYFYVVFYPLTWVLNAASRAILRLMRVEEAGHAEILSNEEIRGLVDVSAEHGEMRDGQADIINSVFRFDERTVARVMIPRMDCHILDIDAPPEETARLIRETKHSRFPVVKNGNEKLIGVLLVKDIVDVLLLGEEEKPWRDLERFCREPLIVPETLKVPRLFDIMRTEHRHIAFVIDEYGAFVGLVTLEDLLEELVGEISDETDSDFSEIEVVEENTLWLAKGLTPLADLERALGYTVDDSFNANTLSGLITNRLERIPVVGDKIDDSGFRFFVEKTKDHRVEQVKIERI